MTILQDHPGMNRSKTASAKEKIQTKMQADNCKRFGLA